MVVLQLLVEEEIINDGHKERVYTPDCTDDSRVDTCLCCKKHCHDSQVLDQEIVEAICDIPNQVSFA